MKYAALTLALTVSLHLASCDEQAETNVYGQFFAPSCDLSLDLLPEDRFELSKHYFFEDIIDVQPITTGKFKVKKNEITLTDSITAETWTLLIKSPEILIPTDFRQTQKHDLFLCWTKFDKEGNKISNGGWRNNKKWGTWTYWSPDGSKLYRVNYNTETGQPVDTIN